jgi:hypothetical protein
MPTKTIHKQGKVAAFNVSPKGAYEGLLLAGEDSAVVQINFAQELASVISEAAPVGHSVQMEIEPEEPHGEPSHPVFRLVSFKANGLDFAKEFDGRFSGTVTRLNYALHGEVNGGILDNGDFLHLKPHGAAALAIEVGMKVKGTGVAKPMIGGHRVIEAEEVNGIRLEKKPKPKPKKKAAHR